MKKGALAIAAALVASLLFVFECGYGRRDPTPGFRASPHRTAPLERVPERFAEPVASMARARVAHLEDEAGPAPNAATALSRAPMCPDVRAVVVSEFRNPRESLATLRAEGERSARLCRIGDGFGRGRVLFIGTHPREQEPRVWLERQGGLCQASMSPPARLNVSGARPSPSLKTPGADLRALMGPVRTVPIVREGAIEGFRVFGVRGGSLLTLLGIENGDVIESINGRDLSTPQHALEAYAQYAQRTSDRLTIGLRRRGTPLKLEYRID